MALASRAVLEDLHQRRERTLLEHDGSLHNHEQMLGGVTPSPAR